MKRPSSLRRQIKVLLKIPMNILSTGKYMKNTVKILKSLICKLRQRPLKRIKFDNVLKLGKNDFLLVLIMIPFSIIK